MKPSLQKLHKFFKLEAERKYDNRAVMGGLERIPESWEAEARADGVSEELIAFISERLRNYPRLSETSRAETLEGVWKRVQQVTGIELDLAPREPQREKRPSAPPGFPRPSSAASEVLPYAPPAARPFSAGRPPRPSFPKEEQAALEAPVTVLHGIGPRNATTLSRLGLFTLRDMLYFLPRRYDDYSQLKPINRLRFGDEVTILATIESIYKRRLRENRPELVEAVVSDGSGALRLTWFGQPWIMKNLRLGSQYTFSGKVDQYLGRLVMSNPEAEPVEHQQLSTNRIVPVYPSTAHITQRWLRKLMNQVVSYWAARTLDPLPEYILNATGLLPLQEALLQAHFPTSWEALKAARQRLAFDEILLLQLGVMQQKRAWQERSARSFETPPEWLEGQLRRVPFELTGAQQRALREALDDLASGRPMNRLLQGDVGSGKTLVAALTIAAVTRHGAQAALMAPTSILAEQHYKKLLELLTAPSLQPAIAPTGEAEESFPSPLPAPPLDPGQIRLLTGAAREEEKRDIYAGLENGAIKLVIGTHALIQEPVTFSDLELVVVDEQHRFGVEQRAALRAKGANPHLMVMTATPIPRSLALTVYGDLDLTVMDEMPPGRQTISTHILLPSERERAYQLIRAQVEGGFQAFIICPLVEESESGEAKAAVEEHARLQNDIFPRFKLGLLHGRMKPEEKEDAMRGFHEGETQILVSTSVVEVGVDVPRATVMLIEGANRYGLAQLHQFRGRVGRGTQPSYCLLIPQEANSAENERLQAMATTNDGFVLAELDLKQRGPGEFLGRRQSGFGDLKLASLTDLRSIELARQQAHIILEKDPEVNATEHQALKAELARFWGTTGGDFS